MQEPNLSSIRIVRAYLHKFNYYDRRLYSHILRNCRLYHRENNLIIPANDIKDLLENDFYKEVELLRSLTFKQLSYEINSLIFFDKILKQLPNCELIEIQLINRQNYSRVFKDQILYDYKVIQTVIDISKYPTHLIEGFFNFIGIELGNNNLGAIKKDATDIDQRLNLIFEGDLDDESYFELAEYIDMHLDEKMISDNCSVIFQMN